MAPPGAALARTMVSEPWMGQSANKNKTGVSPPLLIQQQGQPRRTETERRTERRRHWRWRGCRSARMESRDVHYTTRSNQCCGTVSIWNRTVVVCSSVSMEYGVILPVYVVENSVEWERERAIWKKKVQVYLNNTPLRFAPPKSLKNKDKKFWN